ncbi:holin family protein [Sulfitobacter sp. PS-8MA]|uniref:holin family protein n=1 Tax=Sulfitobacter sp. PS-8MA TaxID=3237707 RepID=UPI0034C69AB8
MGLIDRLFTLVFGGERNLVRDTVEVFRENAEAGAQRAHRAQGQAMAQYGAEFAVARQGGFDRFMDGVNRLPRPMLALGTLGLFVTAMVDPLWFAERMQGIALVPEPLWWLLGVIVSFYFGARQQAKSQAFQQAIVGTITRVPQVVSNIETLRELRADTPKVAETGADSRLTLAALEPSENPALDAWRRSRALAATD